MTPDENQDEAPEAPTADTAEGRLPPTGTPERRRNASAGTVDEDAVATYRAAKGFLTAEWVGAVLMVISFTQLYWNILRPGGWSVRTTVIVGVVLLALGTLVFWEARKAYYALDYPWRKKTEFGATVVAGAGAFFWILFAVAAFLVDRGIELL